MTYTPNDYLPYDFANRQHIGPSPSEISDMLEVIGVDSLETLIAETVPASIRQAGALDFGKAKSERELLFHMRRTAAKN